MEITLQIYRGDDKNYNFTFIDENGAAINITGWTIFLTIKPAIDDVTNDDSAEIVKTVTSHTSPTDGETTVSLDDTDTNELNDEEYVYDFQAKTNAGKIMTIMHGILEVTKEVTRRIS